MLWAVGLAAVVTGRAAEPFVANHDEAKVGSYVLPDPLRLQDGRPIRTAREWTQRRRGEVLELFRDQVYGRSPGRPKGMRFEVRSADAPALGGRATRREVRVWLSGTEDGPWMDLLLYYPAAAKGRVPAFLGLNFEGNHAVRNDPGITLSTRWMRNDPKQGRVDNRATEAARGTEASRWSVERILDRGYALATVYYGDLEPDHAEGWRDGVRSRYAVGGGGRGGSVPLASGVEPGPGDWGAIGAWAWGLSRAMDYLESDGRIDSKRVAMLGHSRLGKTALWAGAQDERFAIVISNNSGEGGAALARRNFGETTWRINNSFPHWFCGNFKKYNNRENELPVDQHQLIALMAPRSVYVASAEKDAWADPRGEFLAAREAEVVYSLFGKKGLGVTEMPGLDQPVGETIGYHHRTGVHDVTDYDWQRYLEFAERHFNRGTAR